jgi:hypothetical protein
MMRRIVEAKPTTTAVIAAVVSPNHPLKSNVPIASRMDDAGFVHNPCCGALDSYVSRS